MTTPLTTGMNVILRKVVRRLNSICTLVTVTTKRWHVIYRIWLLWDTANLISKDRAYCQRLTLWWTG